MNSISHCRPQRGLSEGPAAHGQKGSTGAVSEPLTQWPFQAVAIQIPSFRRDKSLYTKKHVTSHPYASFLFLFLQTRYETHRFNRSISFKHWIISTFIFSFVQFFLKHYLYSSKWVPQKMFSSVSQIRRTLKRKRKFPQGLVLQEKILSVR